MGGCGPDWPQGTVHRGRRGKQDHGQPRGHRDGARLGSARHRGAARGPGVRGGQRTVVLRAVLRQHLDRLDERDARPATRQHLARPVRRDDGVHAAPRRALGLASPGPCPRGLRPRLARGRAHGAGHAAGRRHARRRARTVDDARRSRHRAHRGGHGLALRALGRLPEPPGPAPDRRMCVRRACGGMHREAAPLLRARPDGGHPRGGPAPRLHPRAAPSEQAPAGTRRHDRRAHAERCGRDDLVHGPARLLGSALEDRRLHRGLAPHLLHRRRGRRFHLAFHRVLRGRDRRGTAHHVHAARPQRVLHLSAGLVHLSRAARCGAAVHRQHRPRPGERGRLGHGCVGQPARHVRLARVCRRVAPQHAAPLRGVRHGAYRLRAALDRGGRRPRPQRGLHPGPLLLVRGALLPARVLRAVLRPARPHVGPRLL